MRQWIPLLVLVAVGCEGNSSGKLAQPYDDRKTTPTVDPNTIPKPAASDPAAVALVEKAIREHSGGNRDALKSLAKHAVRRTGKMLDVSQQKMAEASIVSQSLSPDRFRGEFRLASYGDKPYIMVLHGKEGWHQNQADPNAGGPAPLGPMHPILTADVFAEWMLLLFPLLEKSDWVAAPAEGEPVNNKPATGVRVWVGDRLPMELLFDNESGRLVRVKYQVEEQGRPIPKSLTVYEHKTQAGVLVPNKMDYAANYKAQAQWAVSEYDFPTDTPADRFEKP